MANANTYDVLIVGAGISGVNTAYRVQEGMPNYSYAILEGRSEMGGTWSLFKYPGIRSDSDLFTFGFQWDPWTEDRAIADAPSILSYIKRTAAKHGIDKRIKYNHMVSSMNWSSDQQRWTVNVTVNGEKQTTMYSRFIVMGTGYYDYKEPLPSTIPNLSDFKGQVIHPQFWPEDLDYTNKKVVIVGSGATAITLLPAMNEKAASVVMVQRSPGFFFAPPLVEPVNIFLKKWLPTRWSQQLIRWRMMMMSFMFFQFCRAFPNYSKKMLQNGAAKALPPHIRNDPHFLPRYNPWQQRMLLTPGGDFFEALKTGKSDVVTGAIDIVTEHGIKMSSGQVVEADIIITATGLKVQMGGHAALSVDKQPINLGQKFVWKGCLLQDVPNFLFVFGYTNASWTLGADATARMAIRLMQEAEKKKVTNFVAEVDDAEGVKPTPMLNLNSTYIHSAAERGVLPKGGDRGPWVPRSSYFIDWWNAKFGNVEKGLRWNRVAVE